MHNGYIPMFQKIKRDIQRKLSDENYNVIQGSTDSEHIFALFLEYLSNDQMIDHEAMRSALQQAIETIIALLNQHEITVPAQLNLAVSNGDESLVCRFSNDPSGKANSLFWHDGAEYICENGVCRMRLPDEGLGAVIVASEPLSTDHGWTELQLGECIAIDKDGLTTLTSLEIDSWKALSSR